MIYFLKIQFPGSLSPSISPKPKTPNQQPSDFPQQLPSKHQFFPPPGSPMRFPLGPPGLVPGANIAIPDSDSSEFGGSSEKVPASVTTDVTPHVRGSVDTTDMTPNVRGYIDTPAPINSYPSGTTPINSNITPKYLVPPKAYNPNIFDRLSEREQWLVIGQIMREEPEKYPCPSPEIATLQVMSITDPKISTIFKGTLTAKQRRNQAKGSGRGSQNSGNNPRKSNNNNKPPVKVANYLNQKIGEEDEEDDLLAEYYGNAVKEGPLGKKYAEFGRVISF